MRSKPIVGSELYRETMIHVEGDSRKATFIASSEDVDRYGDIIRSDGWQLDNFRTNPVLLFGHRSRELPIGRVNNIYTNDAKQLIAEAEFASKEVNDFADSVYKMVKAGFLNGASVGFAPTKMPNDIKDPTTNAWTGYEFIAQELLELSVVSIPALPGALAIARSLGIDESHVRRAMPLTIEKGASVFLAAQRRKLAIIGASAPI